MMDALEKNGFVSSEDTSNIRFYVITEQGINAYEKWIKDFLDFTRSVYHN